MRTWVIDSNDIFDGNIRLIKMREAYLLCGGMKTVYLEMGVRRSKLCYKVLKFCFVSDNLILFVFNVIKFEWFCLLHLIVVHAMD